MTFKQHENKCTEIFERTPFAKNPHKHTAGNFDKWDIGLTALTDPTHTYNIELKNRDIPFEKYADKGFMIERLKYDALMDAYEETGSEPIFMIFFQGGIGYYWKLLDIEPKWVKRLCTKSCASNTYGKIKEWKECTDVFAEEGKRFYYE